MLLTLIKTQISQMFFRQRSANQKKKKSSSAIGIVLIAILLIYCLGTFALLFGGLFFTVSTVITAENEWLYFAMASVMAFLLMVIGSVFTAKNQLYEAKDNELLLSMPIPSAYILAARIMSLLILNYVFEAVIYIPAAVVYGIVFGYTAWSFICMIIGFFTLGLLSITVISILAFIIEAASKRMKNKRIVTVIFSLAFFAVYMYCCANLSKLGDYLIANLDSVRQIIRTYIPPAYFLGSAISERSVLSFVLYLLCAIVPFAIIYFILSKTFISVASAQKNSVKIKYKEKKMSVRSPMAALILKEITRFGTSTIYMFNAGFGLAFSPIIAVVLAIKFNAVSDTISEMLTEMTGSDAAMSVVLMIIVMGMTYINGLNLISSSSVSLEGKALWIPKSLPVASDKILLSKVYAHIIICTPFMVVTGIILWAGLKMNFIMGLFTVLIPVAYCALVGYIGLLINLVRPRFDWLNETYAVKQGSAVLFTMLAVLFLDGVLALPCIFIAPLISVEGALTVVFVLICMLTVLSHFITVKCTHKTFMNLGE